MLNEKKKNNNFFLRIFNKNARLGSKQKTVSNCQATYQKELCLLFENQAIFFIWANVQIGLTLNPHPLFVLVRFLRTPSLPTRQTDFLNDPLRISYYKNSHLLWLEKEILCSKKSLVFWIKNFISSTKSLLEINELLNFQKPGPLLYFNFLRKNKKPENDLLRMHLKCLHWKLFLEDYLKWI